MMCQDGSYINRVATYSHRGCINALNPNNLVAPMVVFQEARDGVVTPLYMILKSSLENGKLPTSWKNASVSALYKSGDKCLPSNYRPVSLTSVICKMLERIITNHLLQHRMLKFNGFFTSRQHRNMFFFILGKSIKFLRYLLKELLVFLNIIGNFLIDLSKFLFNFFYLDANNSLTLLEFSY